MTEKKTKKVEDQQFLENLENLSRMISRYDFNKFRELESLQFVVKINNYGNFNIFEFQRNCNFFNKIKKILEKKF